jgi:hypothetical protein
MRFSSILLGDLKTTSGSHSGRDTSVQPKKQAQKSHATVPLKANMNDLYFRNVLLGLKALSPPCKRDGHCHLSPPSKFNFFARKPLNKIFLPQQDL